MSSNDFPLSRYNLKSIELVDYDYIESYAILYMSYLRTSNLIINLMLMSVLRYHGDVTMYCPEEAYSTIK